MQFLFCYYAISDYSNLVIYCSQGNIHVYNHQIQKFKYRYKVARRYNIYNIIIQKKGYMNKMMKKYILKGREYINKKLQQFEIQTNEINYIVQQIPGKLKQSLSVLLEEEIDIEDSHVYQNYFKSYPNHHISHLLLDKYHLMVGAEVLPNKYVMPNNKDMHLPSFDQKLQNKALLFRQVIEEYDEGYTKIDEPIICICVVNFHHKRGAQIQYRYPKQKPNQILQQMIVHYSIPDSSHNKHEDYNYYNFEIEYKQKKKMIYGVSYFKQIKINQQLKKNNPQFTRSYIQKSIAIVSLLPLFGYLKVKLSITTKLFFQRFDNFNIIEEAYKELNMHLRDTWPTMQLNILSTGSDLKAIIKLFNVNEFYQIWKAILYQKRIVVFGHSSSSVSSFILSVISLFPGLNTFGIYSKPIAKYMQALRQLALPLRLFSSQNFLYISFHLLDFKLLQRYKNSEKGNYLIGTTNRLLKQSNDYNIELFINLENCTIQKKKSRREWEILSKKQKVFIAQLESLIALDKTNGYQGSQENIQYLFHQFLKISLIQLIQGMQLFQKFVKQCKQYEKSLHQNQTTKKSQQSNQNTHKQQKQHNKQQKQHNKQHNKQHKQHNKQHKQHKQNKQPKQHKQHKQHFSKQFPPIFPHQLNKLIFTQLLLNPSFAYFRQFKNQKLPQIIHEKLLPSLFINNYDYILKLTHQQFIAYNWRDKKLIFGKGNVNKFQGKQIKFKGIKNQQDFDLIKSIYIGAIQNNKYTKNGYYISQSQYYFGEYTEGIRQGYGKLISQNEKYIGNFLHNVYHGQGQLVIGNDIYVGNFYHGEKCGFGTIQGKVCFQGNWEHDQPVISAQSLTISTGNSQSNEIETIQQSAQNVNTNLLQLQQKQKDQLNQKQNKQQSVNIPQQNQQQNNPPSKIISKQAK